MQVKCSYQTYAVKQWTYKGLMQNGIVTFKIVWSLKQEKIEVQESIQHFLAMGNIYPLQQ